MKNLRIITIITSGLLPAWTTTAIGEGRRPSMSGWQHANEVDRG